VRFVDTNIFIRFLTADPVRGPACRELLLRCDAGDEDLYTSESVIGEIFYVLTRGRESYRVDRLELAERMQPIVAARGLHMPQKAVVQRAIEVYIDYPEFDFEDALSVAHMEATGLDDIVSYDGDFNKKEALGITRSEP
jgi:predicted nucleic acid-binding protein